VQAVSRETFKGQPWPLWKIPRSTPGPTDSDSLAYTGKNCEEKTVLSHQGRTMEGKVIDNNIQWLQNIDE